MSSNAKLDINFEALKTLNSTQRKKMLKTLEPRMNKFMAHYPMPKQAVFMNLTCKEAFYGGAAGGGKSDCLLMDALQYVDVPGYSAIIFRKTYADLVKPGALIDRAKTWLMPFQETGEVHWSRRRRENFPSMI